MNPGLNSREGDTGMDSESLVTTKPGILSNNNRNSVREEIMLERERTGHASVASEAHFKKDLGWLGLFAAGYNMTSCWLVIAATMTISLPYGPMATSWGIIIIIPVYLCVSLTLAELISVYPTTGGQYHWASILAPPRVRRVMSYMTGFISWFAWITLAAASCGAIGTTCKSLIYYAEPDYEVQAWHNFLFYEATVVFAFSLNLFGKKLLSAIYSGIFMLSITSFVVFTAVTLAMQKTRQSSEVVWTSSTEGSGWPTGVQVLIALASPTIAFCPIDGSVHLIEEVKNPRRVVPRAVIAAYVIASGTALLFVLSMLYSVSDYSSVLSTPSGFPPFEIWRQASNTGVVPIVFTAVCICLLPIGTTATLQVTSMMTWSLAGDGALAFKRHLSRVHPGLNAPVWALFLNLFLLFLIGCLYLFSNLAYNSIVGVAAILQQITFCVPAALLLWHRRSPDVLPRGKGMRLPGWVGWVANIGTIAFTFVSTSMMFFPPATNPDSSTMKSSTRVKKLAAVANKGRSTDYACVVVGGILVLGTLNWVFYARKNYAGPVAIILHD
ncbi:uncharacterized protein E0L32_010399 [Thyridium curvatum]|uniref:Amino acid transporter n=1 Tax=Thyridium curvatum TaxID=1093900 RepID=A0A507ANL2_9PEZI|nr:uncharacterized protein E0L32_010399 [Thyridium curvatum]TPX07944.1 hypothetical protein E0L32_010399 [Thyridium curvatum]